MFKTLLIVCSFNVIVFGSGIFHVNSNITFYPDEDSTYFGYTVLFTKMGLVVGAPKAKSRTTRGSSPGDVFTCPLEDLIRRNVTCNPLNRQVKSYIPSDYFKDDMWFGAAIATAADGTLVVCAPRRMKFIYDDIDISASSCYVHRNNKNIALSPLSNFKIMYEYFGPPEKSRKDYTDYYSQTKKQYKYKYHRFGLTGMAVTFTKDSKIVIGAPGILEFAGSVFDYKYNPNSFTFEKSPIPNPYFTLDYGPDDYLGYSVESGTFEKNGQVLYVGGAPRSKRGYGQVLIFEKPVKEMASLKIKAKLTGPHMGSYFGSSLCTADLNMDGVSDLLVGAPNYAVKTSDVQTYDQGAVYVYLTTKTYSGFELKEATVVRGSGNTGARFGTSIADLGDIDGDGFTDIAIGAPWDKNGTGVVYIYRGTKNGLMQQYTQRIFTSSAKGFGMSISKGYDVDKNGCNDLAIGAYDSATAYLYRSIPTVQVLTSIKVPDLKNLKRDATNFIALFCYSVPLKASWPNVVIRLNAKVTVDPDGNRAKVMGKSEYEYKITAKAGDDICTTQIITVNNQSDFSKPMLIKFDVTSVDLDALPDFPSNSARLAENSNLESSFLIQLLSCGDDLVCKPWLVMNLEPLKSAYIPGVDSKVGVKISVTNIEEPAFSTKLHLVLPCPPKRLQDSCVLTNLDVMCDLPAPLKRNETVEWEIHLEYTWDGADTEFMIVAELKDPLYMRNISKGANEVVIPIVPQISYNYSGIALINNTVYVTRNTLEENGDVLFTHYYEISNHGPSDMYNLAVEFLLSKEILPESPIEGSSLTEDKLTFFPTNLKANGTTGYTLPLRFDLSQYGEKLKDLERMNVSSKMFIYVHYGRTTENRSIEITTHLVLEPPIPIWPLIVALVTGLLILAAIMLGLYKCGFFSRPEKEDLKQLIENNSSQGNPSGSSRNPSVSDDSSVQDSGQRQL